MDWKFNAICAVQIHYARLFPDILIEKSINKVQILGILSKSEHTVVPASIGDILNS